MKNYDSLDLLKFISCLMIVAIHTQLFPMILYPWLRIAVPLFFITTSFLLFKKIKNNPEKKKDILKKYIVRQLKFYLFWFICLLPITIYFRLEWFNNGLLIGIIKTITSILFSSTFIASWFIIASVEGIIIVSFLSDKLSKKFLFAIFVLLYLICSFESSYYKLFDSLSIIYKIFSSYETFMPSFALSFPVSLIYILIGKSFAQKDESIKITKKDYIMLIIFCILLFIEWKTCYKYTKTFNNDCYFMILPCAYYIFKIFVSINIKLKNAKLLRMFSIISFPLHASVQNFIAFILKHFINNINIVCILNFLLTLLLCFIVYKLIIKLENKKFFGFLKYSH